jgi:hypothetical protein
VLGHGIPEPKRATNSSVAIEVVVRIGNPENSCNNGELLLKEKALTWLGIRFK